MFHEFQCCFSHFKLEESKRLGNFPMWGLGDAKNKIVLYQHLDPLLPQKWHPLDPLIWRRRTVFDGSQRRLNCGSDCQQ